MIDKIAFIVQARVGSSRLPSKIVKPFHEQEPLLTLLISKLKQLPEVDVIIATSKNNNNDKIEEIATHNGVKVFRGEENDVLKRFIDCCHFYNYSKIIRVCSDNPFLELNALKEIVAAAKNNSTADYISFKVGEKPSIQTHYGFWTEYVTLKALEKVASLTEESLYHEHVTNYIYSHADNFKIEWLKTSEDLLKKKIRLTLDTEEDFKTTSTIYNELTKHSPYPTIGEVIDYLEKHQEYYESMDREITKNSK